MGGVLENFGKISILLYMIYRALQRFFGGSLDFWWLIHENVEGGGWPQRVASHSNAGGTGP